MQNLAIKQLGIKMNLKSIFFSFLLLNILLIACTKSNNSVDIQMGGGFDILTPADTPKFITYTIKKGEQFADLNNYISVNYTEQKFIVKFDSSAIYTNINPANQGDINKLYGFSDNDSAHHSFSARFGWNWINNALWLYAYVYNKSVVFFQPLRTVPIGSEINCSIKVDGNKYVFTVNGNPVNIPRSSTTTTGRGYKLYPYFGGDELAPHNVTIKIKEL